MKVLIAPLNWGLGHATRCAALVYRHMQQGDEVVLGGDGESLMWLKREFPNLRTVVLAPLHLRYSKGNSQVWAMVRALPRLVVFSMLDHRLLNYWMREEREKTGKGFDMVVSDNRFGLWNAGVKSVYMTHQLKVLLPKGWQWAEGLVMRLHAAIYRHYDEVWVPDYVSDDSDNVVRRNYQGVSGEMGHPDGLSPEVQRKVRYIGPLSRFECFKTSDGVDRSKTREYIVQSGKRDRGAGYEVVVVLSGLEPQRTLLENEIIARYRGSKTPVLIVRGKAGEPFVRMTYGTITLVPWLRDSELAAALQTCDIIIARSGYSTVMDLHQLGLLDKVEWHPTPGQPEQEYLGLAFAPLCR